MSLFNQTYYKVGIVFSLVWRAKPNSLVVCNLLIPIKILIQTFHQRSQCIRLIYVCTKSSDQSDYRNTCIMGWPKWLYNVFGPISHLWTLWIIIPFVLDSRRAFFFLVLSSVKQKKIKVELYWRLNLTCSQAYTEQWRCYPSPLPPVIIFWQQQAGSVAVVGGGCCSGCRTGAPWCSAVIVRWPWGETWVHTEQSASMQ